MKVKRFDIQDNIDRFNKNRGIPDAKRNAVFGDNKRPQENPLLRGMRERDVQGGKNWSLRRKQD